MTASRIVVGIDPGSQRVGWAVAAAAAGGALQRLDSGAWLLGRTPQPMPERLHRLHGHIDSLLARWAPSAVALEAAFFGRNAHSALRLGEARGVILQACGAHGVEVHELPPATVKRRVAGAGAAGKERLAELVRTQFGIPDHAFAAEDESDALAVAACLLLEQAVEQALGGTPVPRHIGRRPAALPPGAAEQ